jgi:hypothetical protein
MSDAFNEGYGPIPLIYWAFIGVPAIPMAIGLWEIRKPLLWFAFGIWLGSMTLLPWIPWFGGKRFFAAVQQLHKGMSLGQVRSLMREFSEEQGAFADQRLPSGEEVFNYAWDRDGVNDLDNVTVHFTSGRVSSIDVSTE